MSKIFIDTDYIKNELIPLKREEYSKLNTSKAYASNVKNVSDICDWNSIYSKIDDCTKSCLEYIKWINNICREYENNQKDLNENISKISVENVKNINIVVN